MPRAKTPATGLTDTWGRNNRKLTDKSCPECGAIFRPLRSTSTYCSRPCARKKNGGHNAKPETWWTNSKGYIEGRIWRDGKQVRVKKHRLVMEQYIGRTLLPNEDVHHKDGDKQNNDIDNLELLLHGDHSRVTNGERTYERGYCLHLSDEERESRARRMREVRARAAINKVKGE